MSAISSKRNGSHLPSEVQARFSLSAVKYWLRMEQVCADGFQYRSALMPSKRLVYVGLLGIQLAEDGSLCAAACGRPAGRDDRAAYLAAFVAEIINVVVERNRTDHQYVIFFFHFFFPAHTPVRNSFLKILQGTEMCLHVFATGLYNSILSFYHKTWLNTIKYLENMPRKRVRHVKKRVLRTGGRSGKDRRACAAARNMVCCYCYKRKST